MNNERELLETDKRLLTQIETLNQVEEEILECLHNFNELFYQLIPSTYFNELNDIQERYRETLKKGVQIRMRIKEGRTESEQRKKQMRKENKSIPQINNPLTPFNNPLIKDTK